jgi:hypothetical protein
MSDQPTEPTEPTEPEPYGDKDPDDTVDAGDEN